MTLDKLEAHITRNRELAATLNQKFDDLATSIRNNPALTFEGKQGPIARAYLDTTSKVAALAADEKAVIENTYTDLNRSVFGIDNTDTTALIAFRDAQDRADRLETWQEASTLLERAALSNDHSLASAIMARALAEGWSEVITDYSTSHPEQAATIADLAQITTFRSKQHNIFMSHLAYVTPTPSEISGLNPNQIERVAAGKRAFDGA